MLFCIKQQKMIFFIQSFCFFTYVFINTSKESKYLATCTEKKNFTVIYIYNTINIKNLYDIYYGY